MILIFTNVVTARLIYITRFIFDEIMGVESRLCIDSEKYKNFDGPRINYSSLKLNDDEFRIENHGLLFETGVYDQQITCTAYLDSPVFFQTENSQFPFDIFAAVFYLLSRYEEYLPHQKDMYGRYSHKNSLACKEGFIQKPLINIWINHLADRLKEKYPNLQYSRNPFEFIPTYDIDIAYAYRFKGLLRNLGGLLKSPGIKRLKVLTGLQPDPFDSYAWLDVLHEKSGLRPQYFFLVAEKRGVYDKNISPHKNAMWQLVKQHAEKYAIGLHPSWQSGDHPSLLKKEKEQLEAMAEKKVSGSRQHYIRLQLPAIYQQLLAAGITDDFSMGYGSINGFRASVASSFNWYNLDEECETGLRIHPFCFMDANSYYEQRNTALQAGEEMMQYYEVCKSVNGTFISIWHNNFLGTDNNFNGWKEVYENFIARVRQ